MNHGERPRPCLECDQVKADYLRDKYEFDLICSMDPERDTAREDFNQWVQSDPEPPTQD